MARILHIYKSYYDRDYGGVGQVIHQIAKASCQHGFEHEVLVLHDGGSVEVVEHPEARVHYIPYDLNLLSTPMSLRYFLKYRELVKRADLVHYHFPYPVADLLHTLFRPSCPSLVSYHSDVVKQKIALRLYSPLMNYFLSKVDQIVSACDNYRNSSPVLQRFRDKTAVIPYGVEESAQVIDQSNSLKASLKQRFGENFFFFMGALRYYKGLSYLIEAARKTGLPVVIAGCGGVEEELRQLSKGLDNVIWAGRVSDEEKAVLFELSRAFVFPSHLRSEAFGISLIEACQYGKPMISAEIGTGTTFVNQAEETGLVVKPADTDELAEAMMRLAESDALCEQYGGNARARYEHLFTAERMCKDYINLYGELLTN